MRSIHPVRSTLSIDTILRGLLRLSPVLALVIILSWIAEAVLAHVLSIGVR